MSTYKVSVNNSSFEVKVLGRTSSTITFAVNGKSYSATIEPTNLLTQSHSNSNVETLAQSKAPIVQTHSHGGIVAPMPGRIVSIATKKGAKVKAGEVLAVIEAMKMENNITSNKTGTVKEVLVKAGDEVKFGQSLIVVE